MRLQLKRWLGPNYVGITYQKKKLGFLFSRLWDVFKAFEYKKSIIQCHFWKINMAAMFGQIG